MGDKSNRWRGQRWRELVALQFQAAGISTATARALPRSAATFSDTGPHPDIDGIPGIHLDTAAASFASMGAYLDAACSAAAMAGDGNVPAVALYRQQRPSSDAYVVLRLADFIKLAIAADGGRS